MATRIPREFLPLDLGFLADDKIIGLPDRAEHAYIRLLLWAKNHPKTEGFIPDSAIPDACRGIPQPRHWLKELEQRSLIVRNDPDQRQGVTITSWHKWSLTKDEAAKQRKARQAGAKIANHKQGRHHSIDKDCPLCTRSSDARANARANAPKSLQRRIGREELSNESSYGGPAAGPEWAAASPPQPDTTNDDSYANRIAHLRAQHLPEAWA